MLALLSHELLTILACFSPDVRKFFAYFSHNTRMIIAENSRKRF